MENFTARTVLVSRMSGVSGWAVFLDLVDLCGRCPDSWIPGAQIVVTLPSGLVRRYLLVGDSDDLSSYRIAVLRESTGNGGSEEIDTLGLVGRELGVRSPINHFGLLPPYEYLTLASGINMIPILSMIMETDRNGSSWQLICSEQYLKTLAYTASLSRSLIVEVMPVPQDASGHPEFDSVIMGVPDDALVCCFGTEGMLAAVGKCCDRLHVADRLHVERFAASNLSGSSNSLSLRKNIAFDDELKRTGFVLKVLADGTLLKVTSEVFPEVLSSTEEGHCGTCETTVIEERPDHGDIIPTSNEHRENLLMMSCVGGSSSFLPFLGIWAVLTWMVLEGGLYRGLYSVGSLSMRYSRWEGIVPVVTRTKIICNN